MGVPDTCVSTQKMGLTNKDKMFPNSKPSHYMGIEVSSYALYPNCLLGRSLGGCLGGIQYPVCLGQGQYFKK